MIQETDYIKVKMNLNYFLTCNSYLRWENVMMLIRRCKRRQMFEKGQPVIFRPCCI